MLWQWLSPPLAELRCYVLPVFWMTSCVQMWPGTGNARKAYTQSDSTTKWQHGFHALAYTQTDSPSAYFKV